MVRYDRSDNGDPFETGLFIVLAVSVCWLFSFKDTEPSPLQDSSSVRQQGGYGKRENLKITLIRF